MPLPQVFTALAVATQARYHTRGPRRVEALIIRVIAPILGKELIAQPLARPKRPRVASSVLQIGLGLGDRQVATGSP